MSNERKDGGSAFPHGPTNIAAENGMSLRDYMAAKAMVGILYDWTEIVRVVMGVSTNTDRIEWLAKRSYDIADAMLEAREQQPPTKP